MTAPPPGIASTRRGLLAGALLAAGTAACSSGSRSTRPSPTPRGPASTSPASPSPTAIRRPGSLPNPSLPAGTETLPEIDHIVVLMMENHSYDNYLGMLRRGDRFRLGPDGRPTESNPDAAGRAVRAYHLSSTCQQKTKPSQAWDASHLSYANGTNAGFARSESGPVAMGYWDGADLPFYYGLARTFPLADRYFSSVLSQTYPNRRFLLAGTAYGLVDNALSSINQPAPNGTIFDRLNAHSISWKNYYSSLATTLLISGIHQAKPNNLVPVAEFYTDAAAGRLPAYSLVDPDFEKSSEENPQNILVGEAFAARVINAVMNGPAWPKTLLIWCYDEHGGYYDHVPPPAAIAPDSIRPVLPPTQRQPGGYDRYGFRVPCVIVSPLARRDYVSHVVHDHTSILKLIETKWNLPALTYRDAAASDLLDSIDLHGRPAYLDPPKLPAPNHDPTALACSTAG